MCSSSKIYERKKKIPTKLTYIEIDSFGATYIYSHATIMKALDILFRQSLMTCSTSTQKLRVWYYIKFIVYDSDYDNNLLYYKLVSKVCYYIEWILHYNINRYFSSETNPKIFVV